MPAAIPLDAPAPLFAPLRESAVALALSSHHAVVMAAYSVCDMVIIGSGLSGLAAAYELSKVAGLKVALFERSVAPGGSAWLGGPGLSATAVRKPAHALLDELGVAYADEDSFVVVPHAATLTATLLAAVLGSGRVQLFNGETMFGSAARVAAVKELLPTPGARSAALALPGLRGLEKNVAESDLAQLCEEE
jgi:thiamine thiazole synthase